MFENGVLRKLDDYFVSNRKNIYFYRINIYSENIKMFILKYYETALKNGIVIEGKISNPNDNNLSYYYEIMGDNFSINVSFIHQSIKKWLPRVQNYAAKAISEALFNMLNDMKKEGKNENIIKNAYVKFMCWLYYKFERTLNLISTSNIPKILYEGDISNYELRLMKILSSAGCDIVLLQYKGDENYKKLDSRNKYSFPYDESGASSFPDGFNIKQMRKDIEKNIKTQRFYGKMPDVSACTNAWIEASSDNFLGNVLKRPSERGNNKKFFYNCFFRIDGVEDKAIYVNSLYGFYSKLKEQKRKFEICESTIPIPDTNEINNIKRQPLKDPEGLLRFLSQNIKNNDSDMKALQIKAFLDIMLEESQKVNMNKLTNESVYVLCWLKRYEKILSINPKTDVSCFIFLNGCKNHNECLFIKILSKLPVDIIVLNPNRSDKCILDDKLLLTINFDIPMELEKYPSENSDAKLGTASHYAERELDEILYKDSGMYRNRQYSKANSVSLSTTYEEISILWKEEIKYRPSFSSANDIVNIPVIFAKVSGVKDSDLNKYWKDIKALITEDAIFYANTDISSPTDENPIRPYAVELFKNGKLLKDKIKNHKAYKYSNLREDTQDYILDKLKLLIDKKTIKGTFENGTEYVIISTVLNMNNNILRAIQKFDFTRKNPKLVYVNAAERNISLNDSIIAAFLNLVGFDIVFFVPTGYMTVEKYFNAKIIEEHQIGDYMYDLDVPDLSYSRDAKKSPWHKKFFGRILR